MTESGEVLHSLADSVVIIHFEQTYARAVGAVVDKHQWDVALGKLIEERLLNTERHHRPSFRLALQHAADTKRHAARIIIGRADQDFVAGLYGDVFESLDKLG